MFNDYIFESECDVLIALGNCLYKESLLFENGLHVNLFMEDGEQTGSSTKNGKTWWERVREFLAQAWDRVLNFFMNLPQKLRNLPKVFSEVGSRIRGKNNASSEKINKIKAEVENNPGKYPHITIDDEGNCLLSVPESILSAMNELTDPKSGLIIAFNEMSDKVIRCVESNGKFAIDSGQNSLHTLELKIDEVNGFIIAAKKGKGGKKTVLSDEKDIAKLMEFGSRVKGLRNKAKNIKIGADDEGRENSDARKASNEFVKITNKLLGVIGNLNAYVQSSCSAYLDEFEDLDRNLGQSTQSNDQAQSSVEEVEKELSTPEQPVEQKPDEKPEPKQPVEQNPEPKQVVEKPDVPQTPAAETTNQESVAPYDFSNLRARIKAASPKDFTKDGFWLKVPHRGGVEYSLYPNLNKFPKLEQGTEQKPNLSKLTTYADIRGFDPNSNKNIVVYLRPAVYNTRTRKLESRALIKFKQA